MNYKSQRRLLTEQDNRNTGWDEPAIVKISEETYQLRRTTANNGDYSPRPKNNANKRWGQPTIKELRKIYLKFFVHRRTTERLLTETKMKSRRRSASDCGISKTNVSQSLCTALIKQLTHE